MIQGTEVKTKNFLISSLVLTLLYKKVCLTDRTNKQYIPLCTYLENLYFTGAVYLSFSYNKPITMADNRLSFHECSPKVQQNAWHVVEAQ